MPGDANGAVVAGDQSRPYATPRVVPAIAAGWPWFDPCMHPEYPCAHWIDLCAIASLLRQVRISNSD